MAPIENAATAAAILPMLGFIGTVLGLMISLGSMSNGVAATSDPEAIKASLQVTLSGMTLCFSTTLFGCGGALVLRPLIRILDKKTDELIADVTSYTSTWRTEIQK